MTAYVRVQNVSKNYGSLQALNDVSFEVKQGSCTGLLGPNGAGKTTLLKILTGQLEADSGFVEIMKVNPMNDLKAVHSMIAYIPDYPSVYKDLTVRQNIDFFRQLYGEPKEKINQIIEKVQLTEKADEKAKNLSKGLKQRLLIAIVLVHTPKILFLDEPTSGLDPSSTNFIRILLDDLKKQGVSLLISTHLMSLAEKICDDIVFINKGVTIEKAPLKELQTKHGADSNLEDIFIKLIETK